MKVRRTLPPVGYRLSPASLARAAARRAAARGARVALEREVADHFNVRRVFAVSSGKAALTLALRALHAMTGRTRVILPAYTCYSVPSAIVKAGLVPLPCDIAPGSFDYDYGQLGAMLDGDVLCALSVHLFGIPSDTPRLGQLCEPHGIFVVEDAAQAMGIDANGTLLGTRGDVGFFSLGRGKNITCGSGGLILTSRPELAASIEPSIPRDPGGIAADARTLASLAAMSAMIAPRLYWLPAGLPFLRLGETIFHRDFPVHALTEMQALVLEGWPERLASLNRLRREIGADYRRSILAAEGPNADVPYLRYPVRIGTPALRRRVLAEGAPLGIGIMYPTSVGRIPEIHALLSEHHFPESERVASSLLTLPTHPLLSERDRRRICDLVNGSAADALTAVDDQRVAVKAR